MLKKFRKFKGWKVLEWFLTNPDEKISIREIGRRLDISSMTAKHYCDLFENSNFLQSERAGTAKHFYLNIKSRKVKYWRVAYLLELVDEKKLRRVINNPFYIFGSFSKGEWKKESDFDVFIIKIHEFDEDAVNEIVSGMGFEPAMIIVDFYKLKEFKKKNKELINEIKKGIYIGDSAYEI